MIRAFAIRRPDGAWLCKEAGAACRSAETFTRSLRCAKVVARREDAEHLARLVFADAVEVRHPAVLAVRFSRQGALTDAFPLRAEVDCKDGFGYVVHLSKCGSRGRPVWNVAFDRADPDEPVLLAGSRDEVARACAVEAWARAFAPELLDETAPEMAPAA